MKILYVTDLHGNIFKYNSILEIAKRLKIKLVINGGDMLPKGTSQKYFIADFLRPHFSEYEKNKIYYLCQFGNDDYGFLDVQFARLCSEFKYIKNIAETKIKIKGYEFIGFNLVPDYPFRLKDRCRNDDKYFTLPWQYGTGLLSKDGGYINIDDWENFVNKLDTIETELRKLPIPNNINKTIYIIHAPPSNVDLDVCLDNRKVGSNSIYDFILRKQPIMTLHGHIHESPKVTGKWYNMIGKTYCIQPGQHYNFTYVIIDLENQIKLEMLDK